MTFRRNSDDDHGPVFQIEITIDWVKGKRFQRKVVQRRIISHKDPKLFYIDPVLLAISLLYRRGYFGSGTVNEIFGQDVLNFPILDEWKEKPIFTSHSHQGIDLNNPASEDSMNQRFKTSTLRAGLLGCTLYSFRYSFARDLLTYGIRDDDVKG